MKISELLDGIRKRDLVLPEFQREYVWSKDQAKKLFSSLTRDYPVGGLLFWKTDRPPELKNVTSLPEKLGMIQVILDGQQRLTTLYMLISGEIPPYYKEVDILNDPRDLYFNLDDGNFQYYQTSRMKNDPVWKRVVDCYQQSDINVFEIATKQTRDSQEAFNLAQKYNNNLTKLRNVQSQDLPVQSVPSHAALEEAISIFDLVNSQGTKLTDAELALTHITGKWAQARRVMKEKMEQLDKAHFYYDLTFLTRALTGIVTHHALYETVHTQPRTTLEPGWGKLSKILDYLATIFPQRAFIHSTLDLNTTNILIPIVVYLSINNARFPNENALKHAIHWLYAAQMWARYSSQTDQKLEYDLSLVEREDNPWDALCKQIIDQRGRIDVKSSDLDGRWIQHPLYRMTFILAKAQGAMDWFNGAPLGKTIGKSYSIHSHHIFPQSRLYANGYDQDNLMHRSVINEVANRAFLTADTNSEIANRLPEEYFPEVESKYPSALSKQFIPIDPSLWKLDNYEDFLAARREIIAHKINEYMDGLITVPEIVHELPIVELIRLGESATLEFKSTLQWDVIQGKQNTGLRKQVLKTVAAFLNSAGGTLVIGVEDDGNVYGLENDLVLVNKSPDKFANLVTSLLTEEIGGEFASFIRLRLEQLNGQQICVVDVTAAKEPVYIKGERGSEFYIRFGPTSRMLDTEEAVNYISMHWE
jgi:hypothetical protein